MKTSLVVTTIQPPTRAMRQLAEGAQHYGWDFVAVGDAKTPTDWRLDGVQFLSLSDQSATPLGYALPDSHYARKNVGYLAAMRSGANCIVETDDDNEPYASFFGPRSLSRHDVRRLGAGEEPTWCNVYRHFDPLHAGVWPRGFPLELVRQEERFGDVEFPTPDAPYPVQQGLADGDPDVDAVYRMTVGHEVVFGERARPLALAASVWCPWNSQNTTWFPAAYPLMYLPCTCTFRLTDILRSFVAQRCLWAMGHQVLFHRATVVQHRNPHDLLRDFKSELPGYLAYAKIAERLSFRVADDLDMLLPLGDVHRMMQMCYGALIDMTLCDESELDTLRLWWTEVEDATKE